MKKLLRLLIIIAVLSWGVAGAEMLRINGVDEAGIGNTDVQDAVTKKHTQHTDTGTTATTFTVDSDATGTEPADGAGLIIEGGSGDVSIKWDASNDELDASHKMTFPGVDTDALTGLNTEIIKAATGNITAAEMRGQIINTYGQDDNALYSLIAAFEGANFTLVVGTTVAKYVRVDPDDGDSVWKDGATGGDGAYVGVTSAVTGYAIHFEAFQTGASSYDWLVSYIGPWASE